MTGLSRFKQDVYNGTLEAFNRNADNPSFEQIADQVVQQVLKHRYLIEGGQVRAVQEVNWRGQTDETRAYDVYTEPDRG